VSVLLQIAEGEFRFASEAAAPGAFLERAGARILFSLSSSIAA